MLIFLLLWAAITRLPWILSETMLFGFDHGRDAVTVLHLIKTLDPIFIGPPTSIPGLFVGPGWYYFLTPAYWLGQGNPAAGAVLMFLISLAAIWITYKYLGFYEATILATAPVWTLVATGIQSFYPIPFIDLLIVIVLIKLLSVKKISQGLIILLGLMLGVGFHFSSASALFYLVIIPLILLWRREKINWLIFGGAVFITFIPQLLFEIKHKFSQTQAVITYFSNGESQHLTQGKIIIVTKSIINEISLAIIPDIIYLKLISLVILAIGVSYVIKQKKFQFWPEILLLFLVPLIGFWWLHYNVWYAYGLLPLAVIAVGKILSSLPKKLGIIFLILLFINSTLKLKVFIFQEKEYLQSYKGFLPVKNLAIDYIYQQADDKPFSSYHYTPEIYDYAYQYLYFWQGFKGRQLPIEFSYKPGEISYVPEKPYLLQRLPQPTNPAVKTFLIIEKPENVWHYPLQSWLDNIHYSEIISQREFGPELEVWEVKSTNAGWPSSK